MKSLKARTLNRPGVANQGVSAWGCCIHGWYVVGGWLMGGFFLGGGSVQQQMPQERANERERKRAGQVGRHIVDKQTCSRWPTRGVLAQWVVARVVPLSTPQGACSGFADS